QACNPLAIGDGRERARITNAPDPLSKSFYLRCGRGQSASRVRRAKQRAADAATEEIPLQHAGKSVVRTPRIRGLIERDTLRDNPSAGPYNAKTARLVPLHRAFDARVGRARASS